MINYNAEGMAVAHTQKEESLNSSHPKLSLYPFFTVFFFVWGGVGGCGCGGGVAMNHKPIDVKKINNNISRGRNAP